MTGAGLDAKVVVMAVLFAGFGSGVVELTVAVLLIITPSATEQFTCAASVIVVNRDRYRSCVIQIKQHRGSRAEICVALIGDSTWEVGRIRSVVRREDAVEILSHTHKMAVVAYVW